MKVSIVVLDHGKGLPIPSYATPGSAGVDLRVAITEDVIIHPGETLLVPCGFCMSIPQGYEGQIRSRSGLSLKSGIIVTNSPGTIDSDYRGEIMLILSNISKEPFKIERGMRMAQLVICAVNQVEFVEVESLDDSNRSVNGLGSTGVI